MGTRYAADCGYVTELENLRELLSDDYQAAFDELVATAAWSALEVFLAEKLPQAHITLIFSLTDDDITGELDTEVLYAVIDEASLFQRLPTRFYTQLEQVGPVAIPTLAAWATKG